MCARMGRTSMSPYRRAFIHLFHCYRSRCFRLSVRECITRICLDTLLMFTITQATKSYGLTIRRAKEVTLGR